MVGGLVQAVGKTSEGSYVSRQRRGEGRDLSTCTLSGAFSALGFPTPCGTAFDPYF